MASCSSTVWVSASPGNLERVRAFEAAEELEDPLEPEPGARLMVVQHASYVRRYTPFELGPVSLGGEAIGLIQDEYDQLVYDRWVDGRRVRGLTCFPEGDGWVRVEGQPEAWEAALFGPSGLAQGSGPRPREAQVRAAILVGLGLPAPRRELERRWW